MGHEKRWRRSGRLSPFHLLFRLAPARSCRWLLPVAPAGGSCRPTSDGSAGATRRRRGGASSVPLVGSLASAAGATRFQAFDSFPCFRSPLLPNAFIEMNRPCRGER